MRFHCHQGIILLSTLKQNSSIGWDIQIHGRLANKKIYFQGERVKGKPIYYKKHITLSVLVISQKNGNVVAAKD
jgi:hypothetical protein